MDDLFLVVRLADGAVVNVTVGEPPVHGSYEAVARDGAAALAWIGWSRSADGGIFVPPSAPEPEPVPESEA